MESQADSDEVSCRRLLLVRFRQKNSKTEAISTGSVVHPPLPRHLPREGGEGESRTLSRDRALRHTPHEQSMWQRNKRFEE